MEMRRKIPDAIQLMKILDTQFRKNPVDISNDQVPSRLISNASVLPASFNPVFLPTGTSELKSLFRFSELND